MDGDVPVPASAPAQSPGRTDPRPHDPPAGRPRKRTAVPAPRPTVSTNITFERGLHRRLSAFARHHGRTLSQVVAEACAPVVKGVRIVIPGEAGEGDGD